MSKRKICVITGTRAEYGHLYWLLKAISQDPGLKLQLVVTGTHLSSEFGSTVKVIEKDGFKIDSKINILGSSNSEKGMIKSIGRGLTGFAEVFGKIKPDIVVVLGDRFEVFSAAISAYIMKIPIAHIHGGELTKGAFDEAFRHSITKMASIHFPAAKEYADRIIRMGENPGRVFMFGAPGLDNVKKLRLMTKSELEKDLNISLEKPSAIVTYHPVTLSKGGASSQITELLSSLSAFDMNVVLTMPNVDTGYRLIVDKIKAYAKKNTGRVKLFSSLGQLRYLSLMKHADLMIGNSSSGLVEAPSFKLPVVNIGDRQGGRIRARNVIDSKDSRGHIARAIKKALSPEFKSSLKGLKNPYGEGNASVKIKNRLKKIKLDNIIIKEFFDE